MSEMSNASLQLLPEAGATQEQRLEAVSCKALLDGRLEESVVISYNIEVA